MKQTNENNELKQCHACLNVRTTLTPMADFVDILGKRCQIDRNRINTIVCYPILGLCDVCVGEYIERMQFFVAWATKPANHYTNNL